MQQQLLVHQPVQQLLVQDLMQQAGLRRLDVDQVQLVPVHLDLVDRPSSS